jgi:hypothetical protein
VVVRGVSIYEKGYYWSCSLSILHICNLKASRHNLLSYPQNVDNNAHGKCDHGLPYKNSTYWEEVQERLKLKDQTTSKGISLEYKTRKNVEMIKHKFIEYE